MSFEKVNIVRLYTADQVAEGAHLEIRPNPDSAIDSIELCTTDDVSKKWFGNISLPLDPKECKQLGEALSKYADDFDKDNA